MRLSCDQTDVGYHPQHWRCRIFLEGAERLNVITADEEKRWALLQRLDENGRIVSRAGKPQTDEFWGAVRIQQPEGGLPPAPSIDCSEA